MRHFDLPDAIALGYDKPVHIKDIAAIHAHINSYYVILVNNLYGSASFTVDRKHPAYQDAKQLYSYRTYIWVEQDDEEIVFHAYDADALGVLYEQLEQNNYAFVYSLGGTQNEITVYRNQGDDLDALDRENELESLIANYQTDKEE